MKRKIISMLLSLIMLTSFTSIVHADETEFSNDTHETADITVDNAKEELSESEIPEKGFEENAEIPSEESTPALTSDNFKLIVKIPDTGMSVHPTTLRFNLFTEDGVWLGNRAVDVTTPGNFEFGFSLEPYEIGTKFKVVATTGLIDYNYYGSVFALNDECIVETYAYRDENQEIKTCTEAFFIANVLTFIPEHIAAKINKEEHVNSNRLYSETDYLVWVSKANFTVNVFLRNQGRWELIKEYPCSIGATDTPTVTGQFKYHQYQNKWQYSGYYVGPIMRFYNGYAIHSTLINDDGTDRDGRVGEMISHGCVRVRPNDLSWLVGYVPLGTKIYVTDF